MNVWTEAFTARDLVVDLALVSSLFLLATLARRYISVLQRFRVPNCLVAGFAGLLLGPEVLELMTFTTDRMEVYVYHLLTLTFISVGLQGAEGRRTRGALHFGFIQVMTFLLQVIIGLLVAITIVEFFTPGLIPAVGTLLPLGFGMGPGVAFAVGQSWEVYGFDGGGSVGLTIATVGFLVAYGIGMVVVNRGLQTRPVAAPTAGSSTGFLPPGAQPVGSRVTTEPSVIEPLTFHLALIGGIHLASYGVGLMMAEGLVASGLEQEVNTLWGFHFILANLMALGTRVLLERLGPEQLLDRGLLHRTTGLFSDVLIATSILAISLGVVWTYAVPVLIMCLISTLVTYLTIRWVVARVFEDHPFERFTGSFGQMTGNISSGLALVRITDPQFDTPVAQDLALGSGVALVLGAPLFVLINLPFRMYDGALTGYWVVIGLALVYLVVLLAVWTRFGLRLRPRTTWR